MSTSVKNTIKKLEDVVMNTKSNRECKMATDTISMLFQVFGIRGKAEYHLDHQYRSIEALKYVGEVNTITHPHLYTRNQVIKQLVKEYHEDPNCPPALWIKGEGLSDKEISRFIKQINISTYKK